MRAYNFGIGSSLTIAGNSFDNSAYQNLGIGTNYYNTAIAIHNPAPASPDIAQVYDNKIINSRIGIHALNVNGIEVGIYNTFDHSEHPNQINFNVGDGASLTDYHTAIWLQKCDHAVVKINEIENDLSTLSNHRKLRGIAADNSVDLNICGNTMTNMGYAMRFEGLCNTTELINNTMTEYNQGVIFKDVQFSIQGDPNPPPYGTAWDNVWDHSDPSIHQKVDYISNALGANIDWYFQLSNNDPNNIYSPYPYNPNILTPKPSAASTSIDCETHLLANNFNRDIVFGPVVGDSAQYDNYEDEAKYLAKEALFKRLNADTTLLTVGSAADSSFHAFYNAMLAANIGRFDSVNIALRQSDLITASGINDVITEDNDIEANNKLVNDLIISKIAAGDTLNSTDSASLESIFEQHWLIAGNSVYSAAVMLGKEYYSPDLPSLRLMQHEQPKPKNPVIETGSLVRIQPNPTNSLLFITVMAEGKNDVEVYDLYGRLLYKKQAGETGSALNVSNLANGTYTLRIRNEKGEYYKTRFALLK